jgi:Hydantoinase B/oxoprolinase
MSVLYAASRVAACAHSSLLGGSCCHSESTYVVVLSVTLIFLMLLLLFCNVLYVGSGGAGLFTGGDGVIREMMFRQPLTVSILSERRAFEPYGMHGGCNGARGQVNIHYHDSIRCCEQHPT